MSENFYQFPDKELMNLKKKLTSLLPSPHFSIEPIDSGASVRKYFSISFHEESDRIPKRLILMHIPLDRLEIADDYVQISEYLLKNHIPHPRIYHNHRNQGLLLTYPTKGVRLDIFLKRHPDFLKNIYHQLILFLIEMQNLAKYDNKCPAFNRLFDEEKYRYEFQFHVREQLIIKYFKHQITTSEEKHFKNFTDEISQFLDFKLPVFVHRDFQSSNIFYNDNPIQGNFEIIDYQDARSGSPIYDLVSLLWDSYISIPLKLKQNLIKLFYENHELVQKYFNWEQYQKAIDYTIIQRKLHDAGAFVYTYNLLQNDRYLRYIHQAIIMALDKMKKYQKMNDVINLFTSLLGEKNVKNNHI